MALDDPAEFALQRVSGAPLRVTRTHDRSVRASRVSWGSFDGHLYQAADVEMAKAAWRERGATETHSLGVFTRLTADVQALGAPLDWSGALARVIGDEVRHVDLALRMVDILGETRAIAIDPRDLALPRFDGSLRARVWQAIVATLCLGETISRHFLRRCFEVADVPVAREVLEILLADETLHAQLGWELAALLARVPNDASDHARAMFAAERDALAAALPDLFAFYRDASGASAGARWAFDHPEVDTGANFGVLTTAGYARCFFRAMREEIVPQLVAIGFPEARAAWIAIDPAT